MSAEDRRELFKDRNVQILLNKLIEREIEDIRPVPDLERGFRYLNVEKIVGGSPDEAEQFIRKLESAGILERKFYDKIVTCPKCASRNTVSRYYCTKCDSTDIARKTLIEHLTCGCIDSEERFRQNDKMVCPRCNQEIDPSGSSHAIVGSWFACRSCAEKFELPNARHYCRANGHSFTIREAILEDVFSYVLSKDGETEFKRGFMLLAPLLEVLRSSSYEVDAPGTILGGSGTAVTFDILAVSGKEKLVVDTKLAETLVDEMPVVSLFAKVYDTKPSRAVLVIVPGLVERAKRLADLYQVSVIQAETSSEAARLFENFVKQTRS